MAELPRPFRRFVERYPEVHALHGQVADAVAKAGPLDERGRRLVHLGIAIGQQSQGAIKSHGYAPDTCAGIRTALKVQNPRLQVCSTVYTHELEGKNWTAFDALIDVVFLWTWKSEDLVKLDEGVARCRELFPGKPIVLGCYLSDYTLKAPVPMDRLRCQWERIPGYLDKGLIDGFCILGAYLIDHHPEQATWVRDYIAGN